MDSIYKKVKNNTASTFEKDALSNYYTIVHLKDTEYLEYKYRKQKFLLDLDYQSLCAGKKEKILSKFNLIYIEKIDVIYNSLDESYETADYHFQGDSYAYLKKMKSAGYTVVATVGRFTVQKGLHNLMKAAAMAISKNPKLLFVFAGDGEEKNHLINLAAKLGISKNVLFTGFIRGQRLRDIYSVSDIFVMSSISEPFGLTALEAAHHGDCLILTKQSGVSEVIWSALKYDFWDEQKLADEIIAISKNPALKETLTKNVSKEYRQITWNQVAKKCLKTYNSIKHKRK